jgi:hypothetical protein
MIRRHALKVQPRIPVLLMKHMLKFRCREFYQHFLEEPVLSIARSIPYPIDRQVHSLIMLGQGGIPEHTDDLKSVLGTAYCMPLHIPKDARLIQGAQSVILTKRSLYSFNHHDYHGVSIPEGSGTYSLFLVADILTLASCLVRKNTVTKS